MFIDIVYNIALLLSVSIIYATFPFKAQRQTNGVRILLGLVIGAVGLLIMSRPAVLLEGVVFDGRSILLGVAGMFFGAVTTIIAAIMMIIYRIFMGGGECGPASASSAARARSACGGTANAIGRSSGLGPNRVWNPIWSVCPCMS